MDHTLSSGFAGSTFKFAIGSPSNVCALPRIVANSGVSSHIGLHLVNTYKPLVDNVWSHLKAERSTFEESEGNANL